MGLLAGELTPGLAGCWGWVIQGVTFNGKKLLFIPE